MELLEMQIPTFGVVRSVSCILDASIQPTQLGNKRAYAVYTECIVKIKRSNFTWYMQLYNSKM